jgi:hypothetical protein
MMGRRLAIGLLCGIPGYVLGGVGGGWLISMVSSNTHDLSVEAAMTGAFVTGPIVAIAAFTFGFVRGKARPAASTVRP